MPEPTLSERLERSIAVVVAESQGGSPGRFRVTTSLKGPASADDVIELTSSAAVRRANGDAGAAALLLLDAENPGWVYIGAVRSETVPLLHRLIAVASSGRPMPAQRSERLAMYGPRSYRFQALAT